MFSFFFDCTMMINAGSRTQPHYTTLYYTGSASFALIRDGIFLITGTYMGHRGTLDFCYRRVIAVVPQIDQRYFSKVE